MRNKVTKVGTHRKEREGSGRKDIMDTGSTEKGKRKEA